MTGLVVGQSSTSLPVRPRELYFGGAPPSLNDDSYNIVENSPQSLNRPQVHSHTHIHDGQFKYFPSVWQFALPSLLWHLYSLRLFVIIQFNSFRDFADLEAETCNSQRRCGIGSVIFIYRVMAIELCVHRHEDVYRKKTDFCLGPLVHHFPFFCIAIRI